MRLLLKSVRMMRIVIVMEEMILWEMLFFEDLICMGIGVLLLLVFMMD